MLEKFVLDKGANVLEKILEDHKDDFEKLIHEKLEQLQATCEAKAEDIYEHFYQAVKAYAPK